MTRHPEDDYPDLLRYLVPGIRLDEPRLEIDIVRTSKRIVSAPGKVEFEQGEPCFGLLLLDSGCMRVSRVGPDGRELFLYRVRPGDVCPISVSCLMGRGPLPARGTSEGESSGLLLPGSLFDRLLDAEFAFRTFVFRNYTQQLGGLLDFASAVALERLDQRLAAALLARVEAGGTHELAVTPQDLAGELATARERVPRLLEGFEVLGIVELRDGHVVVRDPQALARRAAGQA